MAKSPLKGADAFITQRRPVLRAIAYATLSLMSLVNMAMHSSSWSNTRFMRNNGAFTGVFIVTSSILTMVISITYTIATTLIIRARIRDAAAPKFCQRLASDSIERMVCCLMATWWLSMALNISNIAFIFREEIRLCVQHKLPPRMLNKGTLLDDAARACTVFHGSLALCWMIWLVWVARTWRVFTRSNMHFDSSIFQEADVSAIDLAALKPVTARLVNPETFSPRDPNVYRAMQLKHNLDSDAESQYTEDSRPSDMARGARVCQCADCPLSYKRAQHVEHVERGQDLDVRYRVRPLAETGHVRNIPAQSPEFCCQQPQVIGTATLVTEPIKH